MENYYDYKKFAILYVDDEEKSLKYFTRAFEEHFRILTAARADDGFKLVEQHKDELGVLMTDQRMPATRASGCWRRRGRFSRASSGFWRRPMPIWTRPSPPSTA